MPFGSPHSDYFTDSSFSPDSVSTSSPDQKYLLHRLERIGVQLLRNEPNAHMLSSVTSALNTVDDILAAPTSQSRQPADLVDSGLFMNDDDTDSLGAGTDEEGDTSGTKDTTRASNDDSVMLQSQHQLGRMQELASELRIRYEEQGKTNDLLLSRLEDAVAKLLRLRSENESLRADLSFDHSELLCLKLEYKALEVQVAPYMDQFPDKELLDDFERWKLDYKDAYKHLLTRREKYYGKQEGVFERSGDHSDNTNDRVAFEKEARAESKLSSPRSLSPAPSAIESVADEELATPMEDVPADPWITKNGTEEELDDGPCGCVECKRPVKTPWQEFCDSAAELAGMYFD
ncbi:hypothetical protein H2199_000181 [Coniosporium tulheliwenetii]|nr:hypothetical protein H2199_000181 [Cladosporium sp. JES 115]